MRKFSATTSIFVKSDIAVYLLTIADYLFVGGIRLAFPLSVVIIITCGGRFVNDIF